MPRREFSAAILGMSWPSTDPEIWADASKAQYDKASQLVQHSEGLRDTGKQLISQQSGKFVDGMHEMLIRKAGEISDQADSYLAMSRGSEEVSRLLYGQREDLDKIDRDAHEKIEEIRAAARGFASQGGVVQAVWAVVMAANAQAKAVDAKAAGSITAQAANMGLSPPEGLVGGSPGDGEPGLDLDPSHVGEFGGGGRPGLGGMPTEPAGFGPKPDAPPHSAGHQEGGDPPPNGQGDDPNQQGNPQGEPTGSGAGPREHGRHAADHQAPDSSGLPAMPMPFSGGGSSGGGGGSPLSSAGGGLSSLKPPEMGGIGGMSGGMPQGLSPGGTGMTSSPAVSPAASSPFSQGLNAGLGGAPAAPLAPPVTSAPPTTSAAPAGAVSSGPASVAAAAGSPTSSPSPTPAAAPIAGGPATGAGPVGPLPPFGSDVRSAPVSGGGAVTPTSGSAPATVSVERGGSSAAGPVGLPPGVVGSGVGGSAGAATEGVRASQPDPLLEQASELLDRLLYDSRRHPLADWCVGVFRRASGVETVIVNSEGAGFIPLDVFVPKSAHMLFADPGLPEEFLGRWFSWANPAETMIAFAQWAGEHVELYALAVSIDQGGSSVPARAAGVPHIAECRRAVAIEGVDSTIKPLDEEHMHRLEALDRGLYARLLGVGDGRRPDQSEAWRTTTAAAQVALSRAGAIPDLVVPSVIREVLDLVGRGLKVPAESWGDLDAAYGMSVTTAAGLRPGSGVYEVASPHALAHHDLARLMEILQLWNRDSADNRDLKYADIAYLAKQINDTPRNGAAV
jgi:hypothetical protein